MNLESLPVARIDLNRLENVNVTKGKATARCPACAEDGHDREGNHLVVFDSGQFGCIKFPGPDGAAHRKRIFALAGGPPDTPTPPPPPAKPAVPARSFPTLDEAVGRCTPAGARLEVVYDYPRGGHPFAAVARYQTPGGKTFRQYHAVGAGWVAGAPDGKWPLYGLGTLPVDGPVGVVEGERCQQTATSAGLPAVTSSGGAKAADKTDWTPLAGRDVAILPDHDEPGDEFAISVARILTGLTPPARVRIVRLPVTETGADIVDYLDGGGTVAEVKALVDAAPDWEPDDPGPVAAVAVAQSSDGEAIRARLWEIAQTPKMTPTERYRASAAAVVEWLHGRGRFYYHYERRDYASVMYFDSGRKLLLPVQGDAFTAWLSDVLAINRSEVVFKYVLAALETEGLSERATGIDPSVFWAGTPTAFYLSNGPGRMVRMTAGSVECVDNGTDGILFPYGATLPEWKLVEPVDPFEACALFRESSTQAQYGRELFRLWVCSLPSDQRTKPPLVLAGTIGSGKTRLARGVFELFGLPQRIAAVLKHGDGDFWAAMDAGGLACFDNADTRVDWLPDALAAAATAGTLEKRRLYTDAERVSLRARSWVCITSAAATFASDAGLADRLLVVRLGRREGATAETALSDEIAAHRDAGLSWIVHALSRALADQGDVPGGLNARHPDFAKLAVRIGRAIGRGDEAIAALKAAEADKGLFNIENDTLGVALLDLLQASPFVGTAAELSQALLATDPGLGFSLMSTKRLAKRLAKLWPHLVSVFKATSRQDGHLKQTVYSLQPIEEHAGYAGIQVPFPEKCLMKEKMGTLPKTPLQYPHNPQNKVWSGGEPVNEMRSVTTVLAGKVITARAS